MSRATATDLVYLVAIVGFIFALIGLSSPKHARIGNLAGASSGRPSACRRPGW